MFENNLR